MSFVCYGYSNDEVSWSTDFLTVLYLMRLSDGIVLGTMVDAKGGLTD